MKFDRKKFFDFYRDNFGALNQDTVSALDKKLSFIEQDPYFKDLKESKVKQQELAYYFATVYHETYVPKTGNRFVPVQELGGKAYFERRYGPQTKVGQNLGNRTLQDAVIYSGKGDIQVTGRRNYEVITRLTGLNFLDFPENLLIPEHSYRVAMLGMKQGLYTGRKFSHYFKEGKEPDFVNARAIINGKDRAEAIGKVAVKFYSFIEKSLT